MTTDKKNTEKAELSAQPKIYEKKSANTPAYILSGILAIILVIGAIVFTKTSRSHTEEINLLQKEQVSLNEELMTRDSLIDEWVGTLNQIENDLRTLHSKEQSLQQQAANPELNKDVRANILAEIQEVNALLEKNKAQIKDLNKRLRQSGVKIASLEKQVADLQASLNRSDSVAENLKVALMERNFKVAELNYTVDSLSNSLVEAEEMISARDVELHKGFIASGNYDELEEQGLIHKEGGFLGMGKSKVLNSNLPSEAFKEIDINETHRIALNAKSVQLITDHPESSYKVVESDSLDSYIEIINPDEFWRISRYAVFETSL